VLQDLESLLISVAAGAVPNRQHATAYSTMRLALLKSYDSNIVPGFIHQCISIYKFREFITLYDGRANERRRFITSVFDRLHSSSPDSAGAGKEATVEFVSMVF
jgi:hypothetical protein